MPCWKAKHDTGLPHAIPFREINIPDKVSDLLQSCEEYCLFDCCGFNAINVSLERVARWVQALSPQEREELRSEVMALLKSVDENPSPLVALGDVFTVGEFYNE